MISSENKRYHKIALLVSNKLCGFREISEMIARYTIESEDEMNRLYHINIYKMYNNCQYNIQGKFKCKKKSRASRAKNKYRTFRRYIHIRDGENR